MGFESKGAPNSQHRMIGNACFLSHQTTAPVGVSPRCALQRLGENFFDFLVVDAPRGSTSRRVGKRLDLLTGITAAPLANRGQRHSFASGDLGVTQSLRGSKNDPRSLRITLVGLWSAGYQSKLLLLGRAQNNWCYRSSYWHSSL